MRGTFVDQGGLVSYIAPEARVPANHPLRKIRELVRDVLGELTRSLGRLYASEGRPSIPPEQLLSALLLQVFYGIRSERQLMEQLDYNLLYQARLHKLDAVLAQALLKPSREHVTRLPNLLDAVWLMAYSAGSGGGEMLSLPNDGRYFRC